MAFDSNIKGYMTFGKSFSRGAAFPLEAYEIWTDYDALVAYAANTDPNKDPSYIGQKVAYIDKANNKVIHYGIEIDGTLKELGVTPVGDGKSVSVDANGVISILGIEDADSLTLPRMKEDKSGIEWVPVSAVVQGDGNDNTTYTFTPVTKGEGDAAETYGFIVKTYFNGTAVEGGEFTIGFDVYTKTEVDAAIKEVADLVGVPADDDDSTDTLYERIAAEVLRATEAERVLGERIGVAKNGETAATGVYAYVDGVVEALVNGVDADKIDSLNELIAWVEAHPAIVEELDGRLDAVEAILDGFGGEGEPATVKGYADGTFATKEEIRNADYAAKATTLEGYGITDAYTKNEVYTKGEADKAIADKISEVNRGHSAGEVFDQLNAYKKINDTEVWGAEKVTEWTNAEGQYNPTYTGDSRVDTIKAKLDTVEENAEVNIIETIKVNNAPLTPDANRAVNIEVPTTITTMGGYSELNTKVTTNANNISTLQGQLNTTDGNLSGVIQRLGALEAEVGEVAESRIDALEGVTGQHTKDIGTNTTAITVLNTETIPALQQAIANEADARAKADKGINDKIGTVEEGKTVVDMINAVASTIDFAPYATNARVDEIYKVEGETKSGVLADALVDVAANKAAIALLNNDNKTEGSVKHTVATELAKIISDDDADIDTLNEIAAWIVNDTTGAAKMANDIDALKTKVDTGDQRVSEYIAAQIAAIPGIPAATASSLGLVSFDDQTIKMNENNQLYVAEVSTDNLVLGVKTLVLNGGNAGVTQA